MPTTTITIDSDYPTEVAHDTVCKALERERKISETMVEKFKGKLRTFEEQYHLTSDEFLIKFNNGQLGDDEDYFEWLAYINYYDDWRQNLTILNGVQRA